MKNLICCTLTIYLFSGCIAYTFQEKTADGRAETPSSEYPELKSEEEEHEVEFFHKEPEKCALNQIYKVEYYLRYGYDDYVKQNTTLNCHCDQESSNETVNTILHPGSSLNLYYKEIMCPTPRTFYKRIKNCRRYETCKKLYFYNYGELRENEQYVDAVDNYCICVNSRKCEPVGFLPQSMTEPYDSVVYYRCEETDLKEVKLCNPHQVYLIEIIRHVVSYFNREESEPVKLKSYLTCICDSIETPTFEETLRDTFDATIEIRTYFCPVPEFRELSDKSCEDFEVCRYGYSSDEGIEAPDRSVEVYITNMCHCDTVNRRRSCVKTREVPQIENEYQYIYECMADELPQCEENKNYKLVMYSTNGSKNVNDFVPLRTFLFCFCGRPYDESRGRVEVDNRGVHAHEMINCPYKTPSGVNALPECDVNVTDATCQRDVWKDYGALFSGTYYDYSIPECKCPSDKTCKLSKKENSLLRLHTCRIEYGEPTNAKTCEDYAIFKEEFYDDNNQEGEEKLLQKMSTRFLCGCPTHKSYSSPKPTKHPDKGWIWVKDYPCPPKMPPHIWVKPLKNCDIGERCRAKYFNEYGLEAPGKLYLDFSIDRCICDRVRKCTFNPLRKMPNANAYVEYEYCMPNRIDLSKLRDCWETEIYKYEYHLNTTTANYTFTKKLDTELKCKCNNDKHNQNPPFAKHGLYLARLFKCLEQAKKPNQSNICFEMQLCKEEYFYKYGRDRGNEYYRDAFKEYCNCPEEEGLQCIPVPYLPPRKFSQFDKVLSYRCMGSGKEDLKPCEEFQLYLLEVHEYTNKFRNETRKMNSFLKCICETHENMNVRHTEEKPDPNDERKFIRTFLCPMRFRDSAEVSCIDYAICRKGYVTDVGEEKPHMNYTKYFRTYCKYDKDRTCTEVGMVGNQSIYRCIPKKTNNPTKICRNEEIHRVDVYHYELRVGIEDQFLNHSRIDEIIKKNTIKTRLNTFVRCRCLGESKSYDWNEELDPNFYNDAIIKNLCKISSDHPRPSDDGVSYCRRRETCMTQVFETTGIERPDDETFASRLDKLCICTFPRACVEVERPSRISSIDRCLESRDLQRKLYVCGPNQLYKDVLYLNRTARRGEVQKLRLNTFLMCECELTVNEKYVENKTVSKDIRDEKLLIESHYCPRRTTSDTVVKCIDYAVCRKNVYTAYGEDIDLNLKYLNHTILHCNCDGLRNCVKAGKEHSSDPLIATDIYRCIPTLSTRNDTQCTDDRNFLVVIQHSPPGFAYIEDRMNAFLRCRCNRLDRDGARLQKSIVINDTTVPGQTIYTYECPYEKTPASYACRENDECLIEELDVYGRERLGEKFVLTKYELCKCGDDLLCMKNETIGLKVIHRCIRKYCRVGEVCRIEKLSVEKEIEETTKLCTCEGECSYRDYNSWSTSFYGGTEYHYFDCKPFDPHAD